jgi:phosphoribosylanthranilate isomerase
MTTRIKICGITRLEDAQAAVEAGAHALGFVFYAGSPRCVGSQAAAAIVRALPPFVTSVGLFVNADPDEVNAVLSAVPLDLLQFHGDESAAYCRRFARPFLKAVRVAPDTDLLECSREFAHARGLLLDAHVDGSYGGTGKTFDWDRIPATLREHVVLSGGLTPQNVFSAIRAVRPWAVDVSSGVEASKGIKDAEKIRQFISEVKRADV